MSGNALDRLKSIDRRIKLLEHTGALLGWDHETYMPESAVEERSEQIALIESIAHEESTSTEVGELLSLLGATPDTPEGKADGEIDSAFVREWFRKYRRETKIPKELVERMARETSMAQSAWVTARKNADFPSFASKLESILGLTRELVSCLGYDDHPYDPLLDQYEPWMRTRELKTVFDGLQPRLREIVEKIAGRPQVDDGFLELSFPVSGQERFGREVLAALGYEPDRGRLDISAHPFTTSLGSDDVRITTRYNEKYFKTGLFGIIHECGHALYELGFSDDIRGTILADGASLGIHESQSRTWENTIGRSMSFWEHFYPALARSFPAQLDGISLEMFYRAVNKVEPSLIRVEADEVTYGMHVILRFNLETALLEGGLSVADLPAAWNDGMESLLGIRPGNDAEGVLQDIHWSMGSIGYFPTYALGNLYGAQFAVAMRRAIPDLDARIEQGEFSVVLEWLRRNIHAPGRIFTADELCRKITGSSLDPNFFIAYLEGKYGAIYGF